MTTSHSLPTTAALQLILVAALLAGFAAADAKGRRSSGSRSSSSSHSDKPESSGSSLPSVTIRTGSGSSSSPSSASQVAPGSSTSFTPITPPTAGSGGADTRTPEQLAAIERAEAQKAAEQKAIAEKQEADRQAGERLAAAQKAAADKADMAERARIAAVQEAKRREQAAIVSDTDRVLQRAMADYPVLKTPAGEPVLQKILARQKALVERGAYPSVAMVEAVADHSFELTPRPAAPQPQAVITAAPAARQPNTFGNCRWASATQWVCN